MARRNGIDDYPFSLFKPGGRDPELKVWFQTGRDSGHGPNGRFAAPDRRVYVNFDRGVGFDPLCHAALDLMERDLGGHPDRYDPLGFTLISTTDEKSSHIMSGSVYVPGRAFSGDTEGVGVQFKLPNFPGMSFSVIGRTLMLPIKTSQKFNWSILDDEGFERLLFRLFFELEFDNVQWLQKTRAADSGRDISAERLANGNRVLIQARHQKASINAPDVNTIVVKAETWNPPFDEVIIVTTSSFTQEAIRWAENHNANPGERPTVILEPHGHIEVMLTQHPALISHLGLR